MAVSARGAGATSLLLALAAGASQNGSWCAAVGMPALSWAAAADAGVNLDRLAVVPRPGPEATAVAATLLDGFDLVIVAVPGRPVPSVCSHLSARARHSKSVLVAASEWPGANLTITAEDSAWVGRRRLRAQKLTVVVSGRGNAGRPRRGQVWLPAAPPDDLGRQAATDAGVTAGTRLRVVS